MDNKINRFPEVTWGDTAWYFMEQEAAINEEKRKSQRKLEERRESDRRRVEENTKTLKSER